MSKSHAALSASSEDEEEDDSFDAENASSSSPRHLSNRKLLKSTSLHLGSSASSLLARRATLKSETSVETAAGEEGGEAYVRQVRIRVFVFFIIFTMLKGCTIH